MNSHPLAWIFRPWHAGWFALVTLLPAGLGAQETPVMQDAVTHEQLAQRLPRIQQEDPMKRLPESTGENPAKNPPEDLFSQSDVLCFGGMATLVPKRAILQVPKPLASRMQFLRGSTLMGWSEFYAKNRGWITTVDVSRAQAEGNEPLAADVTTRLKDSTALVVATHLGGPISVLPIKPPPPPPPPPPAKPAAPAASTAKSKP
ncbi:MAG: hypothetical protein WCP45_04715 [Verrucomicrobiota bacterium]